MATTPRDRSAWGSELHADTDAGAEMVDAATRFADDFTAGAMAHDRDGTFAVEHLEKLRADGYLNSPIPRQFGGGGVTSIHDVLVASSRLARGDPSTTIGVNMHFAALINMVRSWRIAVRRGEERKAAALADAPPVRRRDRRRVRRCGQRAVAAGPHAAVDDGDACRRWLGDQRPQGVRHDGPCRHDPQRRRLVRRRPRPGSVRLRDGADHESWRRVPRRLGRARHARLRFRVGVVRGRQGRREWPA